MNNAFASFLWSILTEIALATLMFWGHRRLSLRVPKHAVFLIGSYLFFLANVYNLLIDLGTAFPQRFSWTTAILIVACFTIICLIAGFALDRFLSRFRQWG